MSDAKPCRRCGYPIDRPLVLGTGYWQYTCLACGEWERAMLDRHREVPTTIREGLTLRGDTVAFDFCYPRIGKEPKYLQIGLMDVRAADDLKIHYDFERDGWAVEQCWTTEEPMPGKVNTFTDVEHWQEVGFFPAWTLEREKGIMQRKDDDA